MARLSFKTNRAVPDAAADISAGKKKAYRLIVALAIVATIVHGLISQRNLITVVYPVEDATLTDGSADFVMVPSTAAPESLNFAELWVGSSLDPSLDPQKVPLSVVLTHCHGDIDWVDSYLAGFNVQSGTIVSKCGKPPIKLPKAFTLLELPNVGGCDHTMAYWMAERMVPRKQYNDETILFLKDRKTGAQRRTRTRNLAEMLNIAASGSSKGFACQLEPTHGLSMYHSTEVLSSFRIKNHKRIGGSVVSDAAPFRSNYSNLGEWLSALNLSLPAPYTAVCLSGVYAVLESRIAAVPRDVWMGMAQSLSRGNNIEEGHFAERTWAGVLSQPLTQRELELFRRNPHSIRGRSSLGLTETNTSTTSTW